MMVPTLIFFPLYTWHCMLKRENRGATKSCLKSQYVGVFSFSLSLISSLFHIADLINWKKALPFDRLYRSFADFSILSDPLLLNVLLLFLFLSLCFRFLALISRLLSFFSLFSHVKRQVRFRCQVCRKVHESTTYCLPVAVECGFDDDEVISLYYTLLRHRREWPVTKKRNFSSPNIIHRP